ncbi:thiamine pyrophosphate-dependent enzyme [Streptomyces sp. NPDC054866]
MRDGGSNQGTTLESLNLASVWQLPAVFVADRGHAGGVPGAASRHTVYALDLPGYGESTKDVGDGSLASLAAVAAAVAAGVPDWVSPSGV